MWWDDTPEIQFSCSVVSDSLQPHGLQHARLRLHKGSNFILLSLSLSLSVSLSVSLCLALSETSCPME